MNISTVTPAHVRSKLLAREEIALLDVREEDPFAQAHPLWAANLPLSKLELEAWGRLPRRDVPLVVYDDGEGLALPAATRLRALGYTDVSVLAGASRAGATRAVKSSATSTCPARPSANWSRPSATRRRSRPPR